MKPNTLKYAIIKDGVIRGAEMPEQGQCQAACADGRKCECHQKWLRECAEAKANALEFEDQKKAVWLIWDVKNLLLEEGKEYSLPESIRWEKVGQVRWGEKWYDVQNPIEKSERQVLRLLPAEPKIETEQRPDQFQGGETEKKEPTDNLLSCPFCGEPGEWINQALADDHWYIRCSNGFCQVMIKADRRDKAIGLWNSRVVNTEVGSESQEELPESQSRLWAEAIMNYERGKSEKNIKEFTLTRKTKQ